MGWLIFIIVLAFLFLALYEGIIKALIICMVVIGGFFLFLELLGAIGEALEKSKIMNELGMQFRRLLKFLSLCNDKLIVIFNHKWLWAFYVGGILLSIVVIVVLDGYGFHINSTH